MEENLDRLPNYTCTETIQRSERPKINGQPKLMMLETIRMEVAFVDGKELFGWPGAAKIDESHVGKMIDGSIGTGTSAFFPVTFSPLHPRHSSMWTPRSSKGNPRFVTIIASHKAATFTSSKTESVQTSAGFHGSIWVNPATLDLIRITVTVDDPSAVLGITSAASAPGF